MTDPRQNDQNQPNAQGQYGSQQDQTQAQHIPQGQQDQNRQQGQQPTDLQQGEPSFEEKRLAAEGGSAEGRQPDPRQGEQNTRTNPGGQATG